MRDGDESCILHKTESSLSFDLWLESPRKGRRAAQDAIRFGAESGGAEIAADLPKSGE